MVVLFTAEDSRDIPWAAPVKNDYNRRSEFYAEIRQTLARVIRLFKDAHRLLEFVLRPYSSSWNDLDMAAKLEVLFRDNDTSPEFLNDFAQSRFGKKLLDFEPSFSFKEIATDVSKPTTHQLFGLTTPEIRNVADAAVATKSSPEDRIKFLRAMFPGLAKRAELEEEMGLENNEEFIL
jgi:hypothetical protein